MSQAPEHLLPMTLRACAWAEESILPVPPGSRISETRSERRAVFTKLAQGREFCACDSSSSGFSPAVGTSRDVTIPDWREIS
ncbi:MAG: hypothetical protein QM820_06395 [Minicystis sp.]